MLRPRHRCAAVDAVRAVARPVCAGARLVRRAADRESGRAPLKKRSGRREGGDGRAHAGGGIRRTLDCDGSGPCGLLAPVHKRVGKPEPQHVFARAQGTTGDDRDGAHETCCMRPRADKCVGVPRIVLVRHPLDRECLIGVPRRRARDAFVKCHAGHLVQIAQNAPIVLDQRDAAAIGNRRVLGRRDQRGQRAREAVRYPIQ